MKAKTTLYLHTETVHALTMYLENHAPQLRSKSDAVDYLLRRALEHATDEGTEQAIAITVRDEIATLLDRQSNRIAALLVQSGRDAHRAAQMVEALSAQLLDDTYEAARLAEEARLRASAHYTRREHPSSDTSVTYEHIH